MAETRMCVNCGKTVPASHPRHEPLPECLGPGGLAACTFDMTLEEGWHHWRQKAHALRATIAEQAATIASLRDRERTIREAVNAYFSEQITSKRKLTDAMLAHLPELHGGDSDY